jgi:hypothetical protein
MSESPRPTLDGWNYRVVRFTSEVNGVRGDWLEVREVYYDDEGNPEAYTADEAGPGGETLDELRADHALIAQAFERPIINAEDLPRDAEPTAPPPAKAQFGSSDMSSRSGT